jgi:hypothetical protein
MFRMRYHLSITRGGALPVANVIRIGLAVAAAVMLSPVATADDTIWKTVLERQLVAEKKCELAHYVYVREIEVGGEPRIDGRVRCLDQREFEFTRLKPHQKFEISSCAPAVC